MPAMAANWRATSTDHIRIPASCTPFALPSNLIIPLDASRTVTLTERVAVTPTCYTSFTPLPTSSAAALSNKTYSGLETRDPFYASTIPMAYSIAATTTLAYILLILLFLPAPPNRRPWLQRVATFTVCVGLSIAFAETTEVLEHEYTIIGSTAAKEAREVSSKVVGGNVMKVARLVSNLFLWLAMVQTLIRLFPREREKAIIKWSGFLLILFDTVFTMMQSFVSPMAENTDSFLDAVPALAYLFEISLSLLYACCVVYYSFQKRRYAYFYPRHPFVRSPPGTQKYGGSFSMVIVALMSIASVVAPIVFFVLDIAQKDLAGWGDYVRWVGAASASVVVWEWVDRIEGLEREEGKGGILGREVYEEDEDDINTGRPYDEERVNRWNRPGGGRGGRDGGRGGDGGNRDGRHPANREYETMTNASSSTSYQVNMRQLNTNETPPTIITPNNYGSHVHRRGTPGTGTLTTSTRYSTPIILEVGDGDHLDPNQGSIHSGESGEFVPSSWSGSHYAMQPMGAPQQEFQQLSPQPPPPPPPPPPLSPPSPSSRNFPLSITALSNIWRPWKRRKSMSTAPAAGPDLLQQRALPVTVIPPPPRRKIEPTQSETQKELSTYEEYQYQEQEEDLYSDMMRSQPLPPPTARASEGSTHSSSLWRGTPPTVFVERMWNTGDSGTTPTAPSSSRPGLGSVAEEEVR